MSTRCQIGFYREEAKSLKDWDALIYKHHDGYPRGEYGILHKIMPVLLDFDKNRGLSDTEYASAWLVSHLKDSYLDVGVCKDFHGDLSFYYAVYPNGEIHVYRPGGEDDPESWNLLFITSIHKLSTKTFSVTWMAEIEAESQEEAIKLAEKQGGTIVKAEVTS